MTVCRGEITMKYVIWGCGKRGKSIATVLGQGMVTAFIDKNPDLQGTSFMDIPIIGYKEYLSKEDRELVIIAVKGHEKNIGEELDKDEIPWIYADTTSCAAILNQYRQVIKKILSQSMQNKINIIYGLNIYGAYIYELLKIHKKECYFILQDNISQNLSSFAKQKLPLISKENLKEESVEKAFIAIDDTSADWIKRINVECINVYKSCEKDELFYHSELESFHNIHNGKRCFIIATGPSLRMEDLDTLHVHKEICFSMNVIFKAFEKTKWRPDYYFLGDFTHWANYKKDVLQMQAKSKFVPDVTLGEDDKDILGNIYVFHVLCENNLGDKLLKFSENFSKGAYSAATIIYPILQMAVYMGFSEIYLLGVDFNYVYGGKNNHFNKEDKADHEDHCVDEMLLAFQSAKEYADTHNLKIYNATRGGKLEVYERVEFDSLFQNNC